MNQSNETVKVRNSLSTQESYGLQSLKSTENPKSQRNITVCRICLEETHNKNSVPDTFIKPCRCSGSLEFVHENCLLQWLNTMVKRRIEMGQPLETIHCQICQEELSIQFKNRIVCRKRQSLKNRIKVYWPHLLVSIVFIVLTLGAMGALAFFQVNSYSKTEEEQIALKAVFIIGWILLSISFVIWTAKIFKNFLLKKQAYVAKVQSKSVQLELRQPELPLSQSIAGSQQVQSNALVSDQPSETEQNIVRRRLKVVPLKPAFRNESADCLGEEFSDNINPFRA